MALFGLGEREGIAETADMYIETTLVAMREEDLQPNEGVNVSVWPLAGRCTKRTRTGYGRGVGPLRH